MTRRAAPGLLAILVVAAVSIAAARPFSFWAVTLEPQERAVADTQAFLDRDLPPGLPLDAAIARLKRAGMQCDHRATSEGATLCGFSETVHNEGGTLGEDRYAVRLWARNEALISTRLDHFNVGTGNPNP